MTKTVIAQGYGAMRGRVGVDWGENVAVLSSKDGRSRVFAVQCLGCWGEVKAQIWMAPVALEWGEPTEPLFVRLSCHRCGAEHRLEV